MEGIHFLLPAILPSNVHLFHSDRNSNVTLFCMGNKDLGFGVRWY